MRSRIVLNLCNVFRNSASQSVVLKICLPHVLQEVFLWLSEFHTGLLWHCKATGHHQSILNRRRTWSDKFLESSVHWGERLVTEIQRWDTREPACQSPEASPGWAQGELWRRRQSQERQVAALPGSRGMLTPRRKTWLRVSGSWWVRWVHNSPLGDLRRDVLGEKQGQQWGKVDSMTGLHFSRTTKVSGSRQRSFSHCCLSEGGRDVSMFNVDVKVSEEMKKTEDSGQWQPDLWANTWARSAPGWWGLLTGHSWQIRECPGC